MTTLRRVLTVEQATKLVGNPVEPTEATITTPGVFRDADTDRPVFAYIPLPRPLVRSLRSAAIGSPITDVMRNANYATRSRTFGFRPRAAINRQEGCSATGFARDDPWRESILDAAAGELQGIMVDTLGAEIVTADRERLSVIRPDWFLGESNLWTSGVINKSSRLPYHRDRFNFPTWSAMPVLRRGVSGGYLIIPEYGAVIECRDGHAVLFPGYDLVHGVSPMDIRAADGYRYSIVYYALRGMKDCHTAAEETARARRVRSDRERKMARELSQRSDAT